MHTRLRFTGQNPPPELWREYPNWRNAYGEEGEEGQDETTLLPDEVQTHIHPRSVKYSRARKKRIPISSRPPESPAGRRARYGPACAWRQYGVFTGGNRENLRLTDRKPVPGLGLGAGAHNLSHQADCLLDLHGSICERMAG
jgi:hypothetical protein